MSRTTKIIIAVDTNPMVMESDFRKHEEHLEKQSFRFSTGSGGGGSGGGSESSGSRSGSGRTGGYRPSSSRGGYGK